MIRTIKQRIYVGLIPLAVLAVAAVVFNGLSRIDEASRELHNAQMVTAELLNGTAAEALTVGNTLNFEQIVIAAVKTSPLLVCITLRDGHGRVVSETGDCAGASRARYFPIEAPADGLSDFHEPQAGTATLGELGIVMNEENVTEKRRQVAIQLGFSLLLIVVVLGFIRRLLRVRLIEPLQRIDAAMHALSQRDYGVRAQASGDEEVARLAEKVDNTIAVIATYTRELERRRSDADRALHDADEAHIAREALVRSLTEDLDAPLNQMHSEFAAVAIANQDPALKHRIRGVLEHLQEAQDNLADLIEVASVSQVIRRPRLRDLADVVADFRQDLLHLRERDSVAVNFVLTQAQLADARHGDPMGVLLDLDDVRLRKALVFLIRAMARRCRLPGVHVDMEVIRMSSTQLNLSVHLKAFYDPSPEPVTRRLSDGLSHYASTPPRMLGWSDREAKIVGYLFRAVGITPTFGVSLNGTVNVVLDATCQYTVEQSAQDVSTEWMFATRPIATTIVGEDAAFNKLAKRGDLSNHEVRLVSFSHALLELHLLRAQDVLLIDVSDTAAALGLLEELKATEGAVPHLIAICPPGRVNDALGNRLFELGFMGLIQKPLQYGHIIEVVRAALADPLQKINRNLYPGYSGDL